MRIIKNIIVAFSLYSKIPMPVFEWKEEDMKHNIIFLPWIGAVIGLISWGLTELFKMVELPLICRMIMFALVPLIVTGGFHLDGYMDVQDALKSYRSLEEKLEILKDPHVGAFAIIRLLIFSLVWAGALAVILDSQNANAMLIYYMVFFLARAFSGAVCLRLKHARRDGMLNMETEKSSTIDFIITVVEALVAMALVSWINIRMALVLMLVVSGYFFYYRQLCYKQFGGVTGDTTGYSICSLEELLLIAIAVMTFFMA